MTVPLIAAFGQTIFMLLLGFVAVFLILLVLVQRGRGGGLAGALGGMGGSSAFGAKAGDVFTKITAGTALVWIVLCILATKMTPDSDQLINTGVTGPASKPALSAPVDTEDEGVAPTTDESTAAPADDTGTGAPSEPSDNESTE